MHVLYHGLILQKAVLEDVTAVGGVGEGEVHGVPRAEELEGVFHDFFAAEFTAGEVLEDEVRVGFVEGFALADAGDVSFFELEPPVWFEIAEGCLIGMLVVYSSWRMGEGRGREGEGREGRTYTWSGDTPI